MKTIGEIIKDKRLEKGWTQAQLGEQADVTQGAVFKWESGTTIPNAFSLMALADAFECSIEELCGRV